MRNFPIYTRFVGVRGMLQVFQRQSGVEFIATLGDKVVGSTFGANLLDDAAMDGAVALLVETDPLEPYRQAGTQLIPVKVRGGSWTILAASGRTFEEVPVTYTSESEARSAINSPGGLQQY